MMNPVHVIEQPGELDALLDTLSNVRYVAIDTESNSFYAYYERLCLIQITAKGEDYILDPLVLNNLESLGKILADPGIEKVFHAASNDVLGLKRDFHFKIRNLFDTAHACKLLGYKQLGLATILESHFGVILDKKWQRHDWERRPLGQEQLDYARLDTHYLIELRHRLAADLRARQLWETAKEAFDKACEQEIPGRSFHPEAFLQIRGARALDVLGRKILKALYLYREEEARRRNRAPFRILSNDTLIRIACQRPKDVRDFNRIKGLPRNYQKSHVAQSLLDVIRKAENSSGNHQV